MRLLPLDPVDAAGLLRLTAEHPCDLLIVPEGQAASVAGAAPCRVFIACAPAHPSRQVPAAAPAENPLSPAAEDRAS